MSNSSTTKIPTKSLSIVLRLESHDHAILDQCTKYLYKSLKANAMKLRGPRLDKTEKTYLALRTSPGLYDRAWARNMYVVHRRSIFIDDVQTKDISFLTTLSITHLVTVTLKTLKNT